MKKIKKLTVQQWLPIEKINENGIIKINKNKYVKILKIIPINYNLKSDLEKKTIWKKKVKPRELLARNRMRRNALSSTNALRRNALSSTNGLKKRVLLGSGEMLAFANTVVVN